jgi:hypothetical protein
MNKKCTVRIEEQMNVDLNNSNMTVNHLLAKTFTQTDEEKYCKYDAFKNNCQIL